MNSLRRTALPLVWLSKQVKFQQHLKLTSPIGDKIYSTKPTSQSLNFSTSSLVFSNSNGSKNDNNNNDQNDHFFEDYPKENRLEKRSFIDLTDEEKLQVARRQASYNRSFVNSDDDFTENEKAKLLKSNSYGNLLKCVKYIFGVRREQAKEKEKKQINWERHAKLREERQKTLLGDSIRDLPYMNAIYEATINRANRNRVANAYVLNNPAIIFDFAFERMYPHHRIARSSLDSQILDCIGRNMRQKNPFRMYFCNYDQENEANRNLEAYCPPLNQVITTPDSYLNHFPRSSLVYMCRDAPKALTHFDGEKNYIMGAIIDREYDKSKLFSYAQAKRFGIECRRLPIEEYLTWRSGSKDLTLTAVFEVLKSLNRGEDWPEALARGIPQRKLFQYTV